MMSTIPSPVARVLSLDSNAALTFGQSPLAWQPATPVP